MKERAPRPEPGSAVRVAPRVLAALFLALAVVGLGPSAPVFAGQDDEAAGAEPVTPVGVYITALHDFDTAGDSFGVDYWIWSVHPPELDPLNSVEFVNAEQIESRLDQTSERGDMVWSRSKVRATVLHNWDVRNFPFDRQELRIDLRNADGDSLAYSADTARSGYNENIKPEGWRITRFKIEQETVNHATTLGDPRKNLGSGSDQDHVFVTVELQRDNVTSFFKLVAAVYAAIAIACLSFLMNPEAPPVFSGRMAVLVGALFATVVSLQVSNSTLGSSESVSLVDKIHILALFYVFAAGVLAVISRKTYDSGRKDLARRLDWIYLCVFGVSFALINVVLISLAAAAG